jgi:uncharacterized delta-60 repeat protein
MSAVIEKQTWCPCGDQITVASVPRSTLGRAVLLALTSLIAGFLSASSCLAAPGDLDGSFGASGEFTFQANLGCRPGCVEFGGSYAESLSIQRDGKIVLAGRNEYIGARRAPEGRPEPESALVRINSNGTLDSSFGNGGMAEAPPFEVFRTYETSGNGLLAIGRGAQGIALEKYTPVGEPDATFGSHGVRWYPETGAVSDARIDATGRVVALAVGVGRAIEVLRFLPLGDRDPTFGSNGVAHLPTSELVDPGALALQPDGAVLIVGTIYQPGPVTSARRFLVRLTPSGRPDSSFGPKRRSIIPLPIAGEAGSTVAVAPDGHILVAAGERVEGRQPQERLMLLRYTAAGRLDRSFGHNGIASTTWNVERSGRPGRIAPTAIGFDGAGDPIVVGSNIVMTIDTGSAGSWFLAKYTRHGRDCSFGTAGIVQGDARGGASAVAVQPNGRILVAGNRGHAFMAVRYIGGGPTRTCPGEPSPTRRSPRHRGRGGRDPVPGAAPRPVA